MPVTAPPRPPIARSTRVEALREQALIKEARERARRRHQRYAAAVAIALTISERVRCSQCAPTTAVHNPPPAAQPLAPAAPAPRARRSCSRSGAKHHRLLYRINADGTGLRRLFSWKTLWRVGHWGSWPALSPDGRQVAFQAGTLRRPGIEIGKPRRHRRALGQWWRCIPPGRRTAPTSPTRHRRRRSTRSAQTAQTGGS